MRYYLAIPSCYFQDGDTEKTLAAETLDDAIAEAAAIVSVKILDSILFRNSHRSISSKLDGVIWSIIRRSDMATVATQRSTITVEHGPA